MRPLPALLLLTPLIPACGSGSGEASSTEQGIVILSQDPAEQHLPPEQLESLGIRTYFHDFGTIPVGEQREHIFQLKNTDARAVTITRMQAQCGCTRPSIQYTDAAGQVVRGSSDRTKDIITLPSGTVAQLAFRLDTAKTQALTHNTDKLYTVQIATDSPNRAYLRLEAHAYIQNAFQATPMPIQLGRVAASASASGQTVIIPTGGVGARILGPGPLPAGVAASVHEDTAGGILRWVCAVTLEPPMRPGPQLHRFELMTEGEDGLPFYPLPVEVHAFVVDDVDWSPLRIVARGAAIADGPIETSVEVMSLVPGEHIRVTSAHLEGQGTDQLELSFEPRAPDSQGASQAWTLTLRTRQPFGDAMVRGQVVVQLEGRDPIEIELIVNPR